MTALRRNLQVFSNLGIKPKSPTSPRLAGGFFTTEKWILYHLGRSSSRDSHNSKRHMQGHMVVLFVFFFFNESLYYPESLYRFIFPPTVQEGSLFSTSSPAFMFVDILMTPFLPLSPKGSQPWIFIGRNNA